MPECRRRFAIPPSRHHSHDKEGQVAEPQKNQWELQAASVVWGRYVWNGLQGVLCNVGVG